MEFNETKKQMDTAIESILAEEKPPQVGVPLEVTGVPEDKKSVTGLDAEGRKFLDIAGRGRRYFCNTLGCGSFAVARSTKCRKHQEVGEGTTKNIDTMPELRMVKRFIRAFIADKSHNDPKMHGKLADLENSVQILSDKLAAGVTIEQLRQCGFYFGSILFQYITDGNRYESAKKEFTENMQRIGCFSPTDIKGMLSGPEHSVQPSSLS
jgi:hypothetical protein